MATTRHLGNGCYVSIFLWPNTGWKSFTSTLARCTLGSSQVSTHLQSVFWKSWSWNFKINKWVYPLTLPTTYTLPTIPPVSHRTLRLDVLLMVLSTVIEILSVCLRRPCVRFAICMTVHWSKCHLETVRLFWYKILWTGGSDYCLMPLYLHTVQRGNTYAKLHEYAPFEMNYKIFLRRGIPPRRTPPPSAPSAPRRSCLPWAPWFGGSAV